jgi:hypothetical protein
LGSDELVKPINSRPWSQLFPFLSIETKQSGCEVRSRTLVGSHRHDLLISSRHFGDACNELGQMLFRTLSVAPPPMTRLGSSPDTPMTVTNDAESILREVYGIFQEKVVPIADLANACYTSAIEIFTILRHTSGGTSGTIKPTDGNANLIAVRCNMSCLRRFLSSTLCEMIQKTIKERLDSPSVTSILQNNSSPLLKCSLRSRRRDHHNGPKFFSPLEYIYQAVEICQDSIFNLQSSPALQSTGAPSILSLELATNYTFSGLYLCCCSLTALPDRFVVSKVFRRDLNCLCPQHQDPSDSQHGRD